MNQHEFAAAAAEVRESGFDLEEWLGVDEGLLAKWEQGSETVPRIRARQLMWLVAQAENQRLAASANLPRCTTREAMETRLEAQVSQGPPEAHELEAFIADLGSHAKGCSTCRNNREWEKRNLRQLGTFPMPGVQGLINSVLLRIPPLLLPATIGAAFLAGVVGLRVIVATVMLALQGAAPSVLFALVGQGLIAIAAASLAGGAGGLVIPLVRPTFVRMGAVGDYLTGLLVVETYMIALVLLAPVAFGESIVSDSTDWTVALAVGAIFGLFGAYMYRRDATSAHSATAV